jgi:hypothetical protein
LRGTFIVARKAGKPQTRLECNTKSTPKMKRLALSHAKQKESKMDKLISICLAVAVIFAMALAFNNMAHAGMYCYWDGNLQKTVCCITDAKGQPFSCQ